MPQCAVLVLNQAFRWRLSSSLVGKEALHLLLESLFVGLWRQTSRPTARTRLSSRDAFQFHAWGIKHLRRNETMSLYHVKLFLQLLCCISQLLIDKLIVRQVQWVRIHDKWACSLLWWNWRLLDRSLLYYLIFLHRPGHQLDIFSAVVSNFLPQEVGFLSKLLGTKQVRFRLGKSLEIQGLRLPDLGSETLNFFVTLLYFLLFLLNLEFKIWLLRLRRGVRPELALGRLTGGVALLEALKLFDQLLFFHRSVPVPSALRSSCFLVDPFNFILKSVPFSVHSFADF